MLAAKDSVMSEQIYVALLGEGLPVWRPVRAYRIEDAVYIIERPEDYDAEDEQWEFPPGSTVICEKRKTSDGEILAAVRSAQNRKTA